MVAWWELLVGRSDSRAALVAEASCGTPLQPAITLRAYKHVSRQLNPFVSNGGVIDDGIRLAGSRICVGGLLDATFYIDGLPETPYEGDTYTLHLLFGGDYPFSPPKAYFDTASMPCHPNVDHASGVVCLGILSDDFSPALTPDKVAMSIRAILAEVPEETPELPYLNPKCAHRAQLAVAGR